MANTNEDMSKIFSARLKEAEAVSKKKVDLLIDGEYIITAQGFRKWGASKAFTDLSNAHIAVNSNTPIHPAIYEFHGDTKITKHLLSLMKGSIIVKKGVSLTITNDSCKIAYGAYDGPFKTTFEKLNKVFLRDLIQLQRDFTRQQKDLRKNINHSNIKPKK